MQLVKYGRVVYLTMETYQCSKTFTIDDNLICQIPSRFYPIESISFLDTLYISNSDKQHVRIILQSDGYLMFYLFSGAITTIPQGKNVRGGCCYIAAN